MIYSLCVTHTKLRLVLGLIGMVLLNGCTTPVSPVPDNALYSSAPPYYYPPSPPMTFSQTVCHQVQKGENLYRIGLQYGQPYEKIAQWNGLRPSRQTPDLKPVYDLQPGQKLRVSPNAGTCY